MTDQTVDETVLNASNGRPLVTFALFAYNQQKYIREAVESALSQTYQPLEIILSDDCSSDRTFQIMEEMVAKYDGPHVVKLNRNTVNMGLVRHVFDVGAGASGEYVVVAAGDDISKPHRTEALAMALYDPDVWAVSSGYDLIDESGNALKKGCRPPDGHAVGKYLELPKDRTFAFVQGSTAAYKKFVFDIKLLGEEIGIAEDGLLTFYIYLKGGNAQQLDTPLVRYRRHRLALSHQPKILSGTADFETRMREGCRPILEQLRTFERMANNFDRSGIVDVRQLQENIRQTELIVSWPEKNLPQRLLLVAKEILLHRARFLKWELARIWGSYPNYQPKMLVTTLSRW
jgi:hypothetical protein